MSRPTYPPTSTGNQVDEYHGIQVPDPYRWLEEDTGAERAAWIAAQNAITTAHLARLPLRARLRQRFEELLRYPRYYGLCRRGSYLLFKRNDGLQNQLALYVQDDARGTAELLIDPNTLSRDGTIRLTSVLLSRSTRYLAYGLSYGGVDWEEYRVLDMTTRRDLPDKLEWVKCSTIGWRGDGFYYSRYPAPSEPSTVLSARNEHHQVWYHRVGTSQSDDTLIYEDRAHRLRLHLVMTTEDERFVVLHVIDRGAGHAGNAIHVLDTAATSERFIPVVTPLGDEFRLIDDEGERLLFLTNHHALNWRVVSIDPRDPDERHWLEVIPETEQPLEAVTAAADRLFATYREDATHRVYVFRRTGALDLELPLPGVGTAAVFGGPRTDVGVFWTFTNATVPTTIYRYNVHQRTSSVFQQPAVQFDPERYQTKRVFYPSKDGTQIPMFIVHRKDIVLNGSNPALLTGYGGFALSVGLSFDPFVIALLERGFVYAIACLRGGGEYGETWHRAGWREHKQIVFDDCIAAAEWLLAKGYTSSDRCALHGASNGGLLVGAVMTQRPELFRVALPAAGIFDMLRAHRFTMGANWTAEHGSSDDPAMLPVLLAYSPLHNIRDGVSYPATLVTTSEHDDRVVPAHSFKFVAVLQQRGGGPNPYLIRIDTNSGHSAVSLPKALDEKADMYAFMLAQFPASAVRPGRRRRSARAGARAYPVKTNQPVVSPEQGG